MTFASRRRIGRGFGRLLAVLALLPQAAVLQAQPSSQRAVDAETTGSHIGGTTQQTAVIQLSGDTEIDRILALIQAGDDDAAVERARAYVTRLRATRPADESLPASAPYFALNALCIALTRTGEIDAALATCTEAIELQPDRWTALNSRGTAHFAAGEYASALADYRTARALIAPDAEHTATIDHNIALAAQRLGSRP